MVNIPDTEKASINIFRSIFTPDNTSGTKIKSKYIGNLYPKYLPIIRNVLISI